MKSEEIKQITNKATDQLIAALEGGRSEALTSYLAAIARFHRYSLRNVMLIASQKPAATHVAGFHTWKKLGRFVKKGEKGVFILAPIIRRKTKDSEQNQTHESSMRLYKPRIYLTKEDIEAISLCDPRNLRFFRPRLSARVCFLMTNAL